jgi:uncharacterized iron-regulated membrane protein
MGEMLCCLQPNPKKISENHGSPISFNAWRSACQTNLSTVNIHGVRQFPLSLGISSCFACCGLFPSVGSGSLLYEHAAALGNGFKNDQHQVHGQ